MRRRSLLGLLALAPLGGCGWHLRGSGGAEALPFRTIALEDRGADVALYRAVERGLMASGVQVRRDSGLRLVLLPTRWHVSRTQLTLTGDTAAELMSLKQPFELWRDGKRLIADTVEVYRDHQVDTAALAASEAEKRSLRRQMRREAARQVLRRLRYLP